MIPINIILVDDHKIIRDGLKTYLEGDNEFNVIGEASNGKEAMEIIKETSPDIVVTDVMMPEMNGIELCKAIVDFNKNIKVIALTMMGDRQFIRQMLNNGVSGYLLKSCTDDELKLAIKSVNGGKKYYSQEVTEAVMTDLMDGKSGKLKVAMDMPLSEREKEVLHLVIKEYTNQEIADKLFISTRTVDAHKRNILDKTGSKNVAGLVFYALERKLFDDF